MRTVGGYAAEMVVRSGDAETQVRPGETMTRADGGRPGGRRRDIDWLRIAAVLLLVPFHTARVFNWEEDFYIKNVPTGVVSQRFIDFVGPWHMTGKKFLYEIGVWCMILGLLGLAQRFFTAGGPVLGYATEAAYPFYILHQTVIVAIAYFIVRWDWPSGLKFAAIAVASFVLSLLLYELAVRRWGPVCFLFGMRPRKKRRAGTAAQPAPGPAPPTTPDRVPPPAPADT